MPALSPAPPPGLTGELWMLPLARPSQMSGSPAAAHPGWVWLGESGLNKHPSPGERVDVNRVCTGSRIQAHAQFHNYKTVNTSTSPNNLGLGLPHL